MQIQGNASGCFLWMQGRCQADLKTKRHASSYPNSQRTKEMHFTLLVLWPGETLLYHGKLLPSAHLLGIKKAGSYKGAELKTVRGKNGFKKPVSVKPDLWQGLGQSFRRNMTRGCRSKNAFCRAESTSWAGTPAGGAIEQVTAIHLEITPT